MITYDDIYRTDGGCYRRDETGHVIHLGGCADTSETYPHWESGKYDPRCSWCWLGYSHSAFAHVIGVNR